MDGLLRRGLSCITVLDVSGGALARARARLGDASAAVRWLQADVTDAGWEVPPVDLWHDRAVFHFLTEKEDRQRYANRLRSLLKPGGSAIIGTFALDGPDKCSGMPVFRYSSATLGDELGPSFELVTSVREEHRTPAGAVQAFQWSRFVHRPPAHGR